MKRKQWKNLITTHMQDGCWHTPTNIGLSLGQPYDQASSKICPLLKELVQDGIVEKSEKRTYRLKQHR